MKIADKITSLREGKEPPVDPRVLAFEREPGPEGRATLLLSIALNETGPKRIAVPWDLQVQAALFYNLHGLARTLDRIVELLGPEALETGEGKALEVDL